MIKGDIVLVPFPFTNLTGVKNRPALILIPGTFDVTIAFITSQPSPHELHDLILHPSKENGLKAASYLRLSKLATIDKALLIGRLGKLTKNEIYLIDQELIKAFQIDVNQ